MGNSNGENKFNKLIDFTIKLDKISYFPGENISGTLNLMGKPGLLETQLTNPQVKFEVYDKYRDASIQSESSLVNPPPAEILNHNSNIFVFNTFIGSNLLTGVNIPFSYQIPYSFNPTCSVVLDSNIENITHYFSAEFPSLKVKRTMGIIIKNIPNFTKQNNLLKIPCSFYAKKSKSILFVNKGEFEIKINLPKNLFYYDEKIPYEINLNLKNLHLKINGVEVSILRTVLKKIKVLINSESSNKAEIAKNYHEIKKDLKEVVINNEIEFPKRLQDNSVFPPSFYESAEKGGYYFSKISYDQPIKNNTFKENNVPFIAPSFKGKMLSVEYNLKIKLKISSSTDEIFFIPIDFCLRPDEKDQNINNLQQINSFNYTNNNINNNMNNYYPNNNMNNYYINNNNYNNNNNNYNNKINNYDNKIINYNNNINNYDNNINNYNNNNINYNNNNNNYNNINNNYNNNINNNYNNNFNNYNNNINILEP